VKCSLYHASVHRSSDATNDCVTPNDNPLWGT